MKNYLLFFMLFASSISSWAVSFDCERFNTGVYRIICGSSELSHLDDELTRRYEIVKGLSGNSEVFREFVRSALRERGQCNTEACLLRWYRSTIDVYKDIENEVRGVSGQALPSGVQNGGLQAHQQTELQTRSSSDEPDRENLREPNLDDADAQFFYGKAYFEGVDVPRDLDRAVYWLRKAADQGMEEAQIFMATIYMLGEGVTQSYYQAFSWFLRAATEHHNAYAQYQIGEMYARGHGARQNYISAARWFRRAAYQNFARAQGALGFLLANGYGVRQNDTEAVDWYLKAASQGDMESLFNLGVHYEQGRGVRRNLNTAKMFYGRACDAGYQKGCDDYARLNALNTQR